MNVLLLSLICQCLFLSLRAKYSTILVENPSESANRDWIGICTSSSGQFVAASGFNGIYTSNDYGYQWTVSPEVSGSTWEGIACSSSGEQLCTISYIAGIYISQDFGVTWKNVSSIGGYQVASSSSGQYLYATGSAGIASSDNYGGNWTVFPFDITPKIVSCSSSGQYVATGIIGGYVYVSSNYGASFYVSYHVAESWVAISFDASGQYLTAAGDNRLYTSSNYGSSWIIVNTTSVIWTTIATTADGSFRIAGTYTDGYYYSEDYGSHWSFIDNGDVDWACMATSASGQYFYGVAFQGGIYGNYYSPTSQPSRQPSSHPSRNPTSQPSMSPTRYQEYSYTLVKMDSTIHYYQQVAGSSSGQYLFAAADSSSIVISDNFGNSITQVSGGYEEWTSVACSSSGQYVYIVSDLSNGFVYQSVDFGNSWNALPSSRSTTWVTIATNSSGQAVYAYAYGTDAGNCMYYSYDYGASWNCTLIELEIISSTVSCSASGQFVTLVTYYGVIYCSSNFGVSYYFASAPSQNWTDIAMSSGGQYQIACGNASGVYTSTNYGANWIATVLPKTEWSSVAVSGSGQFMFAAMGDTGSVYSSVDYGVTWSPTYSPEEDWTGLTVSSSGEHLVGVVNGGGLYTNHYNIPTSMPSNQPSGQPNAAPTGVPSCQPTSQPSLQPHTSFPTSQPSVCPSVCPSSQPSSYPTFSSGVFDSSSVVLSYTSNSSFTFNNLGCGSHAFVSASILVSYLDASTSGFIAVWASTDSKSVLISDKCAPSSVCGSMVCAVNVNVTSVVSCSGGGSVTLLASTVNADEQSGVDTLCTYKGTPGIQYALSYELSVNPQPTAYPTPAPSVAGPGDLIFEASPNTPFYVIVTFTLLFMALGVVLVRLREGSTDFGLTVSSTCLDLGMIGYHLASEVFYIIVLYNGQPTLGALIILIRLTSVLPAIYFLVISVGPSRYSQHYGGLLNKHNLFTNASVYSVVILLMLFEHCLIKYFPWNKSEYIQQSRGFPDHWIFLFCMSFKFFQLLASLVIQIVVLSYSDAYLFNDGADKIALALVLLYFISSVLTVIVFAITNLVRWKAGIESSKNSSDIVKQQKNSNDDDDGDKIESPFHSEEVGTELRVLRKEEWKGEKAAADAAGYVTREYLEEREGLLKQTIEEKEALLKHTICSMEERQSLMGREMERREEQWKERFSLLESKLGDVNLKDNV